MPRNQDDRRRKHFVKEYISNGFQLQKAAIAVGYSPKSARSVASWLMRDPGVLAQLKEEFAKMQKGFETEVELLGITKIRMVKELARIAFADITEFAEVTATGVRFRETKKWKKGAGHVVKKITESTSLNGGSIGLELHSKIDAIKEICNIMGWRLSDFKDAEAIADRVQNITTVNINIPSNGREVIDIGPAATPAAPEQGSESDASGS